VSAGPESRAMERINQALSGRYRVERELGEGGMATVYLAHDERHDRKVALKVLKPELAAVMGGERFLTEIRTTANLQHPHILPLFDSGEADGVLFYVMPFVKGESLRAKLDRDKQLSVDDAVRIAKAVAGALDHAHRQGVIHRDIKPANILLQDGQPMVADFGIALAVSAAGGGRLTETGLSLGTPFYMSPEQATADRDPGPQSDVYSLACVLYEMIAGDPPHTGSSAQAVLARILTDRPRDLTELRDTVPGHVAAAVARGLAKVPADRFGSAAAFAAALDDLNFTYSPSPVTSRVAAAPAAMEATPASPAPGGRMAWSVAALAVLAAVWGWLRPAAEAPFPSAVRVESVLEEPTGGSGRRVAVSRDGRWFAYATATAQLRVRRSDQSEWRDLPGTDGALQPTFSPEGDWLAFTGRSGLQKTPVEGGPVLSQFERGGVNPHWSADGFIYFTGVVPDGAGVVRVPDSGGTPELLVEDAYARYASPLPDGSALLYTHFEGLESSEVRLLDLASGEVRTLLTPGANADYVEPGYIVYGHGAQTVMAVPFDLGTREITGPEGPVLPGVSVYSGGATQFTVSTNGTAVYLPGGLGSSPMRLALVDLRGEVEELPLTASPERWTPRFSPDGRYIAFDDGGQIHVFDQQLGTNAPLTFELGDIYPIWTPDGASITYSKQESIRLVAADASGTPEVLLESGDLGSVFPHAWTSDGAMLVLRNAVGGATGDLHVLDTSTSSLTPYLQGEWNELAASLSPGGRWLAYGSDESGQSEVYVRSFPQPGARFQVSSGGGAEPVWSPDGETLYYRQGDRLVAASVTVEPDFRVVGRETALTGLSEMVAQDFSASYDIHPDGDRFVFFMGEMGEGRADPNASLVVVTNWFTELRERMGEGR
jgi:Tol biopolymer transport system component